MSKGSIVGGLPRLLLCIRNDDNTDDKKRLLNNNIERIDPEEKPFTQKPHVIIPD
ncbi:hypothetical protein [Lacibacter sediminis]|uniref:Uncharacterized protein n=1 Tax=Lacibacter sediminis TaxID=2760713 RepID=A0A7G5XFX2_9BACT|nr:hypothetical protein [Lacibacter sediminis]QNA44375.1 hypothetical protein H4075_20295 [Lacibacter sediminis]